ncbi:MAG: 2-polyprenyl-6-hydroxyphenyl methylase/3-demethylubiquinone-9 3-methyltransferase [Crocinitomicaceae bacterium]|jgi:2-polyprenyl-6-hydroxyphenyl methylase/3-demethylubiquinone-9 3-methyltransferase
MFMNNVDLAELAKFESIATRWWDTQSEFKPLHDINPMRTNFIDEQVQLAGKNVLDVGCGGGILSEAMTQRGAQVTAIDMGQANINTAKLHALESGLSIDYQVIPVEQLAEQQPASFDVVTCLEMLEHVPDPVSIVNACYKLCKPGGQVIFSTLNRNPKSFLLGIIGAEYLLNMVPKGTHDYKKFIRPSELANWSRQAGLTIGKMTGMTYNPITKVYKLGRDTDVNYLMQTLKPIE